ncbi:MAG TPA: hypothetical protein VK811_00655 [Candidatus Acidoferrum sp.]|jgi:hypothetical protein|nr:hypothetical protein [Candidatus Acidoferrum sp.]
MYEKKRQSVRDPSASEAQGHGKITSGLVTPEMVETRARALALIAGREPNRVTTSDRIQAKKELLGDDSGDAAVDDTGIMPGGMGYPPVSTGKQTKNHLPTDDQTEIELIQEGLDEAEHDEMLQAAKTRTKSEG